MACPKCGSKMEAVEFGTDVRVMRCTGCHGIFAEKSMLKQMREEWLADTVLDIGSSAVGAKQNVIKDIPCLACGTTMDRVQDEEQQHITLDVCPNCGSVYLDAGELTDMKHLTLMDHLQRLLSKFGR